MALFNRQPVKDNTGGINYIVQFELEISLRNFLEFIDKRFVKKGININLTNEDLKKIATEIPRMTFKKEVYEWELVRIKKWYMWKEEGGIKERYIEDDNPKIYNEPYVIWDVGIKGVRLEYSYRKDFDKGRFMLYLLGGKFGKKDCVDHWEPLEENVILSVDVYNFKELEKYHLLHDKNYRDATESWFYTPSPEHRTYKNNLNEENMKTGIFWTLNWFDYTNKILPKLKYKSNGDLMVDIHNDTKKK